MKQSDKFHDLMIKMLIGNLIEKEILQKHTKSLALSGTIPHQLSIQ